MAAFYLPSLPLPCEGSPRLCSKGWGGLTLGDRSISFLRSGGLRFLLLELIVLLPAPGEGARPGKEKSRLGERLKAKIKGGYPRLAARGLDLGRKSNSILGDDRCCLRSTLRGLYALPD